MIFGVRVKIQSVRRWCWPIVGYFYSDPKYPGLHGYSEIVAQAQLDEAVAARIVVDILPVDAEQDNRLQVQRPAV